MGNGSGLKTFKGYGSDESVTIDAEDGVLTEKVLEDALSRAVANSGLTQRNPIIMSPQWAASMGWHAHPQFAGTSWEDQYGMTKRERKFAQLHVFIFKLGVLPPGQINNDIHDVAVKRLKRAKWARYQKPKKV